MRILFLIDSLGSGGAQRQVVNLAVNFKKEGHNVLVLIYHDDHFFKSILDDENIPVKSIIEKKILLRIIRIRKFIRGNQFDTILSFQESPNLISEISSFPTKKWKLIVSERSSNPKILTSYIKRTLRWFHLFTDYVVTNSQTNISLIKKACPIINNSKLKVIYNMVTIEINKITPCEIFGNGLFNLLIVSRHHYLKNLDGLIEAVDKLSEIEKSKLLIHWIGDKGTDNSKVNGILKIKQLGLEKNFKFYDANKDISSLIYSADAIGLFSFYEGLPNSICEAMYIGKPVLSSSVSDLPVIISNMNLLCDPKDSTSIMKSLRYLINLSKLELKSEGLRNAERAKLLFDPQKITADYLNLMS